MILDQLPTGQKLLFKARGVVFTKLLTIIPKAGVGALTPKPNLKIYDPLR